MKLCFSISNENQITKDNVFDLVISLWVEGHSTVISLWVKGHRSNCRLKFLYETDIWLYRIPSVQTENTIKTISLVFFGENCKKYFQLFVELFLEIQNHLSLQSRYFCTLFIETQ